MNFFIRHRKSLVREGIVPFIILVFLALGSLYFHPAGGSWTLFLDGFFESPLSMALEAVVDGVILLYVLHHILSPQAPRYRGLFVVAALSLGVVINGIYNQRLSHTADFMSSSGLSDFFGCAALFYCIYRLVLLVPDRARKMAIYFFALLLTSHLIYSGMGVYKRLSSSGPCAAQIAPDLWSAVIYGNSATHCEMP